MPLENFFFHFRQKNGKGSTPLGLRNRPANNFLNPRGGFLFNYGALVASTSLKIYQNENSGLSSLPPDSFTKFCVLFHPNKPGKYNTVLRLSLYNHQNHQQQHQQSILTAPQVTLRHGDPIEIRNTAP